MLLTHIGFDSDKELARLLKPEWGVDMIIGGHSHTILEKPEEVNHILITQAGVGTNQIGRYDIIVDDHTNSIIDYRWQLIPIDTSIAKPDEELEKYINSFKEEVDRKYNTIICKMAEKLTHLQREVETSLGNLFSDIFAKRAKVDVAFTSSGSIRSKELGPLITLGDLVSCYAFDDPIYKCQVSGDKLYRVFSHIMRPENRTGEGECYQVNQGIKAMYSEKERQLTHLSIRGELVNKEDIYSITLQGYHYNNSADYLNITQEELKEVSIPKVVSTSGREILEEYLRNNQNLSSKVEGRLVYY
ncbi:MAG: Mannosylglucosyl-3-phosphoglycerate phosphatase [candidate division WS2 bacterium]|nr:Mannosylglucosyl-3-phosphoglycerate phosphatase [Candidatus Psychracetigena formicireducens]